MGKTRLEAFSDGVLAIIITIMVLELKVPHSAEWKDLAELCPVLFSYIISFIYIGIYWGNHHHLLHTIKHVSSGIIWANLNLLFWLSLIPFATSWMGENNFSQNPVIVYAILLLLCGISYTILQFTIMKNHHFDDKMQAALRKVSQKGIVSLIAYSTSIAVAFFNPSISLFFFVVVAILWLIPDKNIERALDS